MQEKINKVVVKIKNKGFTLVELLAVIVVLAIIALIGFTKVGSVIETAREKAAIESVNNYIKAVNIKIMNDMTKGITFSDGTYSVENFSVDMNGTKPTNGSFIIKESKVISGNFTIDKTKISYDIDAGTKVISTNSYTDGTEVYFNLTTNSKCNEDDYVPSNSQNKNLDGCLKWYAYLQTSDKVNLLLDHNIATKVDSPEYVWWEFVSLLKNYGVEYKMLSIVDVEKITGYKYSQFTSSEIIGYSWLYANGGNYWLSLTGDNKYCAVLNSEINCSESNSQIYSGRPSIVVSKDLLN